MNKDLIDPTAKISDHATIPDLCFIGSDCEIGPDVHLAVGCEIGKRVRMSGEIKLRNGVEIGDGTVLVGPLTIGASTKIGRDCQIGRENSSVPIQINSECQIGRRVVIEPGVMLGDYVFVKAESRVIGDVPNYSLVQGDPGALIGFHCACGGLLKVRGANGPVSIFRCLRCGSSIQITSPVIKKAGRVLLSEGRSGGPVPLLDQYSHWHGDLEF